MPNFKTIMFSQTKISLSKIFLFLLFFGLLFSALPSVVKAESKQVTGYAWSSNIGWIKFDTGKTSPVMYDTVSGNLSGYAWSSNIGWIYFGPNLTNGTTISGRTPANWAKADTPASKTSSNVSGWARACAGTVPGDCSTNISRSDGWDGWIKMSDTWSSGVSLNLNSSDAKYGEFTGYAWGSEVVGWISFNCSNTNTCGTFDYKVSISLPKTGGKQTLTVNIYGEKWTNGTIAGGSVMGTEGFSCVGNKTTDSSVAVGADKLLETVPVTCTKDYTQNTKVDLSASPASGCSAGGCVLKKWDGACSGGNCSLTMDDNKSVSAYFKVSTGIPKGGEGTCSDGIKNQDETGIDTGGVCGDGSNGTCFDNIKNQDETGIDTGGVCGGGDGGNCSDGIKNQDETGIDTGGVCDAGGGVCNYNGAQDNGETGTDCGGGGCPSCDGGGGGCSNNTLTVNVGSGTVTVVADDGSPTLTCSNFANCSQPYSFGTGLTLTESEIGGESFSDWSGGKCSGSAETCTFPIDNSCTTVVNASFGNCACVGNSCSPCEPSEPPIDPTPVPGECGTANKTNRKNQPQTQEELCREGNASAVSGGSSGPWDWTCSGQDDGADSSCHAGNLNVIIQEI